MRGEEGLVEGYLFKRVKRDLNGYCLKFLPYFFAGFPDRIVLVPGGRIILVETKAEDGEISRRQRIRHVQLRKMGFDTRVIWTTAQVDKLIEEIRRYG